MTFLKITLTTAGPLACRSRQIQAAQSLAGWNTGDSPVQPGLFKFAPAGHRRFKFMKNWSIPLSFAFSLQHDKVWCVTRMNSVVSIVVCIQLTIRLPNATMHFRIYPLGHCEAYRRTKMMVYDKLDSGETSRMKREIGKIEKVETQACSVFLWTFWLKKKPVRSS